TPAVAPAAVPQPAPAASASPYLPPVPPVPPAAVVAPAPEARIPRLAELPESTRRELPRLAISGSVYSDDAASRFVIVNGEVVRE
ncbi:general secretion pathway protein GspB, partial [Acinetobacter baumannii]